MEPLHHATDICKVHRLAECGSPVMRVPAKSDHLGHPKQGSGGRCLKSCQLPQPRFETIAQNGFGNVNLIMLLIAATSKFK